MSVLARSSAASSVVTRQRTPARTLLPMRPARAAAVRVQALFTKTKTAIQKKASLNGAPEPPPKKRPGLNLGFTKENELFVGRAAMLGFAFSLIGELVTGRGALAQLGYEVFDDKLNILQIDGLVIGLIVFNLIAAILPSSGTFVPDEEVEKRPAGALQDPRVTLAEPKKFFGITRFGFTKENERFVGRVAQLGFAASLIGETWTGKGPLAQFDIETGINLRDTEFGLAAFILFLLFAAITPGSGRFVNKEEEEAAEDA